MKKRILLLTVVMAMFAFNSLAQRTIDWAVAEIQIPPSEMKTKADKSGSNIIVQFVAQNNGTDTAQIGDSVWYRYEFVVTPSYKLLFPGPNVSTYSFIILTKQMAPGDTLILNSALNTNLVANISLEIDLVVVSRLYKRGGSDVITEEAGAGLTNNTKSEKVIWYNAQGNGVSVRDIGVENDIFTIYPNPSDGNFTISTAIKSGIDEKNILNIFDVNGRIVYSKQISSTFTDEKLDLSHLNNGLYYAELSNGETTAVSKLQISK